MPANAAPRDSERRWDDGPIGALIDHIVATYHRPLPAMLARLQAAASMRGARLTRGVDELCELLLEHLRREEELVFPWLRRPNRGAAGVLVAVLEHEHGDAARSIADLRELAADQPDDRAGTAGSLSRCLQSLQEVLEAHVQLEDKVLFPRALAAAANDDT